MRQLVRHVPRRQLRLVRPVRWHAAFRPRHHHVWPELLDDELRRPELRALELVDHHLTNACTSATAACAVSVAAAHTSYNTTDLHNACLGDNDNCAGRLAAIHTSYNTTDLHNACSGSNADCVVALAMAHPSYNTTDLHNGCP